VILDEEKRRAYYREYIKSPAQQPKQRARCVLGNEIRQGRIIPPSSCENCGAAKPEAHHEDYSKPLDVKWLCRPCHGIEHRKEFCVRGHLRTPGNIYTRSNGDRVCRECSRESTRNRQRRPEAVAKRKMKYDKKRYAEKIAPKKGNGNA
jgi:hypothetical protein